VRALIAAVGILALGACTETPDQAASGELHSAELGVNEVLDDFHLAAAEADEERYFDHFAPDGIFLGTDATERWTVAAFREYAHPHFAEGEAWTFRAARRDVALSRDTRLAWFDEDLETEGLGPARGSGVLRRDETGRFRIVQYNLAITVPNERFGEVKALLAGGGSVPAAPGSEGEADEGLEPASAGEGSAPTASTSSSDPPVETETGAGIRTQL